MSRLYDEANPSEEQLIEGLAAQFGCPEAVALSWLTQLFAHFDPKAAAERLASRPHQ